MKHLHLLASTLLLSAMSYSQTTSAVSDEDFQALQQRFELLADSIEQNNSSQSSTSIGGYGELHYNNLSNGTKSQKKEIDFHRFVLFFNHEFSSKIRMFSEFELEHALVKDNTCSFDDAGGNVDTIINSNEISCKTSPGEVELEQAYIQIDISDNQTLNAGVFLVPVGIINETHEPPTFYGTERNPVEKNIIPATWWEAGAMLSGHMDNGVSYDLAITSGLNGGTNIRGGRQKVASADASNLAVTGRIKFTGIAGLEVAATVQVQDDMTQDSTDNIDGATLIETHAIWNQGPITAKALYARWDIDGTATGNADVQDGMYVEASYKVKSNTGVFVRHNIWDNGGDQKAQTDFGLNYWPHEDVVFKVDYQLQDDKNEDGDDSDGFNMGVGYQF